MKYISYCRVSTDRQGQSGLGLEAQRKVIEDFISEDDHLLNEYIEIESGKQNNRPELHKAILEAKQTSSKLVIAKLDRLSRNVSFIFELRDSNVDFIALDVPGMNTITLGIMSVVAQHERELISQRIKQAFAEKKRRGERMGTPQNLTKEVRLKGLRVRQENAYNNQANLQSGQLSVMYRERGMTLQAIADRLNESGYRTRYGKLFQPRTVKNLIERYSDN